jgi:hypothetical protein
MHFTFGNCSVDCARRELRRGGKLVAIEPQVFDVLVYLIQHRDRVVSRDDLLASVWGGRIVSESTLSSRINSARSAIGDSGEGQHLIRTLPRKGSGSWAGCGRRKGPAARWMGEHQLSRPDPPSRSLTSPRSPFSPLPT